MGEHRLVPTDEVVAFITHLERQVSLVHHAIITCITLLAPDCTTVQAAVLTNI